MLGTHSDNDLLDLLFASPGDPDLWTEFLAHLAIRLNAPGAGFMVHYPTFRRYDIDVQYGLPAESLCPYEEHYGAIDPWFQTNKEIPEGTVALGSSYCPPSLLRETEFYNDFLKKYNSFLYQCGVTLENQNGNRAVLSLLREERQPDFNQDDIPFLEALFPHLHRALRLHRKMLELKQAAEATTDALDRLDLGLIALREDRTVSFINQNAERLLRSGRFLTTSSGKLVCKETGQNSQLRNLLRNANCREINTIPIGGMVLRHEKQQLFLTVLPCANVQKFLSPRPMALLLLIDPMATPQSREQLLSALFDLTPIQASISTRLLNGAASNEIASQIHTSADGLRFQLKEIFKKTRVKRQSQLVRLISQLPGNGA